MTSITDSLAQVTATACLMVFAAGCATVQPIVGPDGSQTQLIHCSVVAECYSQARSTCQGNYKVVDSNAAGLEPGGGVNLLVKCDG